MITKSKARGAARKAGKVYMEAEYAPGHTAYVQVVKSDLWRVMKDYPNDGPLSGVIDDNGDVWISPRLNPWGENGGGTGRTIDVLVNRIDRLERKVSGSDQGTTRSPAVEGRGPVLGEG